MTPKHTYEQLIEKLVRAKVRVEAMKGPDQEHTGRCVTSDPTGYGPPCDCGADEANSRFDDLLDELSL